MYKTYKPYLQTIIMWALKIRDTIIHIGSDCASCHGKIILVISPEKICIYEEKKWFFFCFYYLFSIFFLRYLEYNTREYSIINSQLYGTMGKTDLSYAYNNIWRVVYNNMYIRRLRRRLGMDYSGRIERLAMWRVKRGSRILYTTAIYIHNTIYTPITYYMRI